jgi:RHS repeat-associated protein
MASDGVAYLDYLSSQPSRQKHGAEPANSSRTLAPPAPVADLSDRNRSALRPCPWALIGLISARCPADSEFCFAYNENDCDLYAACVPRSKPNSARRSSTPIRSIERPLNRLSGMTMTNASNQTSTIVSNVTYNVANQLSGMTFNGVGETRSYNVLNQLTNITAGTTENLTYNYPAGANNGKLSSMSNGISGETVTYTYDSLKRLLTASDSSQGTVQWAQQYGFDSFGNLESKTIIGGPGQGQPSTSVTVNPANNQIQGVSGLSYDANGNTLTSGLVYDAENRVISGASAELYAYDGQNQRIFSWGGAYDGSSDPTQFFINIYSPGGQKLATYELSPGWVQGVQNPDIMQVSLYSSDAYFGGRRLAVLDQLGSVGTYFPWGEDRGSTNPQNTWSFATYWRDLGTNLDYAKNRYYSNAYGRFMTPDPSSGAGASNPQSWNKYAYVTGDPVNTLDPSGLDGCSPDDPSCTPGCDPSDPTSCCDPSDPSCSGQPPGSGGSGPKGPTPPAPTPVPCNSTVVSLAGDLGGSAGCDVGVGPNVELFTSLGDFNSFLEGIGIGPVGGTGGVLTIGGVSIGWGEITIGVLDPEVVISIAAVAGAVAIYNYWQQNKSWPACIPPVGTIGYRYDQVPPGRPHYPIKGDHVNLYKMNQNPNTGQCFWQYIGTTAPPPPPGSVPITPAAGGTN